MLDVFYGAFCWDAQRSEVFIFCLLHTHRGVSGIFQLFFCTALLLHLESSDPTSG